MLTAIELQNFKAFGDTQRIELRPLTLLFGPNSGGKSTIIHALHYARELLLGRSCDVHRTESGNPLNSSQAAAHTLPGELRRQCARA